MRVFSLFFVTQVILLLAIAFSFVSCYDPNPLQDYCVAVNETNGVFVNGKFCKDPRLVTSDDFYTSGFNIPGDTRNRLRYSAKVVDVNILPGLNTLGVSLARFDFAPGSQSPPHYHPRASELLTVLEGNLMVGFVSSNQDNNRLFTKVLNPGDVYAFPIGLIHFQVNVGRTNAVALAGLGSQNPGVIYVPNALFASTPFITPTFLARAFQISEAQVRSLQLAFSNDR